MHASTDRILTAHVSSMPRPEGIRSLLRAWPGETICPTELDARLTEAMADLVQGQAATGIVVATDGVHAGGACGDRGAAGRRR